MPSLDATGQSSLSGSGQPRQEEIIGVLLQGEFQSFFEAPPEPVPGSDDDEEVEAPTSALISKSPGSARLLLVSSNDFASDQVLSGVIAAAGTQYFGPLEFLMNSVDWALEDSSLMTIRSRAHFNRTLPPLPKETQASIEYGNYAAALIGLALLFGLWRLQRKRSNARLAEVLT
jgi:ABC-2 type transport system permease protein